MAFTYGTITNAKGGSGQTISAYQVRLGYELQSQDTINGTSTYKLQLEARSTNSSYKTYGYNQTTTIDGTSLSAKTFDMRNTNVWQIFGTRTITVSHSGEYIASKSGSFTTTATSSSSLKSGSASVTVVLPSLSTQSIRLQINNTFKRATPYVMTNSSWQQGTAYVYTNNQWKKGE